MELEPRKHFIERQAYEKGYRVSPCGTIVRLGDRPPRTFLVRHGYYHITVKTPDYGGKNCTVHRLQAYQKFGERIYEPGIQVRHLDGNQKNNHIDNIGIGTALDNHHDKPREVQLRTALHASRVWQKYDHEKVRAFFATNQSYKLTMAEFGITSKGTLHHILKGKSGTTPAAPAVDSRVKDPQTERAKQNIREFELSPIT